MVNVLWVWCTSANTGTLNSVWFSILTTVDLFKTSLLQKNTERSSVLLRDVVKLGMCCVMSIPRQEAAGRFNLCMPSPISFELAMILGGDASTVGGESPPEYGDLEP